jgi:hypothetical protein
MGKNKSRSNKKGQQILGIYTLNGVKDRSAIKIKHLETGTLDTGQQVRDTSVHKYEIAPHIFAEIFACNITDVSLMKSKKQPVLYVTIAMIKPLKQAILCNVLLMFTITQEISSKKQFLNSDLAGKFTLEVLMDGNSQVLDDSIEKFPGNQKIIEKLENLTKTDGMVQILTELANIEEEKIAQQYRKDFEYFSMPTATVSLKDYQTKIQYDYEPCHEVLNEEEDEVIDLD